MSSLRYPAAVFRGRLMEKGEINVGALTELTAKYKNIIANIAVVLAAVFISFNIYSSQQKDVAAFEQKKAGEIEKNKIIEQVGLLENKYMSYKRYVNKKDASQVIGTIGELAERYAVKIISVRPGAREATPVYVKYPFNLNVQAENYHILAKFIAKLESHPHIYIIKALNIRLESGAAQKSKSNINADIDFYTFILNK